jgi:hypothetical protein
LAEIKLKSLVGTTIRLLLAPTLAKEEGAATKLFESKVAIWEHNTFVPRFTSEESRMF